MPIGPQGQKRPADVIGCAVKVCRIATGEEEEEKQRPPVSQGKPRRKKPRSPAA